MFGLLAEAFNGGEDVVGGFGPPERFWIGIVPIDETADVGFELGSGSVDAAVDLLAGEFGEPTLDLIDP